MTRAQRRAGTKSLACMECQKRVKTRAGISSKTALRFRGKSRSRLLRHLADVHGK